MLLVVLVLVQVVVVGLMLELLVVMLAQVEEGQLLHLSWLLKDLPSQALYQRMPNIVASA